MHLFHHWQTVWRGAKDSVEHRVIANDIISHKFTEETQYALLYKGKVRCKAPMPSDPSEREVIFSTKILPSHS